MDSVAETMGWREEGDEKRYLRWCEGDTGEDLSDRLGELIDEGLVDEAGCEKLDNLYWTGLIADDELQALLGGDPPEKHLIGRLLHTAARRLGALDRFLSKIKMDAEEQGGCWWWQGATDRWGHGKFSLGGRWVGAHRAGWLLLRGPIPEGHVVHHTCLHPPCVNPDHMEFMTAEGHNEHHGGSWTGLEVSGEQPRDWRAWRKEFLATGRRPGWQPR